MAIKLVVAITDGDWFEILRRRPDLDEVNFWAPGGGAFRALAPGELFLFKLHSPRNFIVGGGVFAHSSEMPCSLAWEAFGVANGAIDFAQMRSRIVRYRKVDPQARGDFTIGCRILTQPFFFEEAHWIPVPPSWPRAIQRFLTYDVGGADGLSIWERVQDRLRLQHPGGFSEETRRFGAPTTIRPRLGQGAFRILVTDTYQRRCAVTGERTLPVLDAAHIRPFHLGGEHRADNGLLLRRDIHRLFDLGYVTVTPDLHFEVSSRIKEEYENGRHYYALHGQQVQVPKRPEHSPDVSALTWHNEHQFRS